MLKHVRGFCLYLFLIYNNKGIYHGNYTVFRNCVGSVSANCGNYPGFAHQRGLLFFISFFLNFIDIFQKLIKYSLYKLSYYFSYYNNNTRESIFKYYFVINTSIFFINQNWDYWMEIRICQYFYFIIFVYNYISLLCALQYKIVK